MDVTIEQQGDIAIVRPSGRLDFAASAGFQDNLVAALAGAGTPPKHLVIDASALEYVSSAGLRAFLVGARGAKAASIRIAICALTPTVREVFQVSGFDRLIPVVDSLSEALSP